MALKKFTDDELKTIYRILHATWQEIGGDMLEAHGGPMPRDEVVDVVLDADYADRHVRLGEKDVWGRFKALPLAAMNNVAKGAFPHARYGM